MAKNIALRTLGTFLMLSFFWFDFDLGAGFVQTRGMEWLLPVMGAASLAISFYSPEKGIFSLQEKLLLLMFSVAGVVVILIAYVQGALGSSQNFIWPLFIMVGTSCIFFPIFMYLENHIMHLRKRLDEEIAARKQDAQ